MSKEIVQATVLPLRSVLDSRAEYIKPTGKIIIQTNHNKNILAQLYCLNIPMPKGTKITVKIIPHGKKAYNQNLSASISILALCHSFNLFAQYKKDGIKSNIPNTITPMALLFMISLFLNQS
ncbi:MAG: hypothetical protein AAB213_03350 [Candidatus Omnitrophota bacterium]